MSYQQALDHRADASAGPPPGWYPDPGGLQALRWWDGTQWTQRRRFLPSSGQESQPHDQSDPAQRQRQPYRQDQSYQGQPSQGESSYPPQQLSGQKAQGEQPPQSGRQHDRRARASWPSRHKVLTGVIAVTVLFIAGSIGAAAGKGSANSSGAAPVPTVTVTQILHDAAPAATVSANAQGEAIQISASGVYVVGQDIQSGAWHTSGSPTDSNCYYAMLNSTNTNSIIENNNFTGPETVDVGGAKAFEINGDCTWQREG